MAEVTQFTTELIKVLTSRVNRAIYQRSFDDLMELRKRLAVIPATLQLTQDQKTLVEQLLTRVKAATSDTISGGG